MKSVRLLCAIGIAAALLPSLSLAQTNPVEHRTVPHLLASGPLNNLGPDRAVVFSHVVESPGADWIRLTFRRAELGVDSYLRLTSLRDGAVQRLTGANLQQWQNTSAYFNGSAVRVELIAGPGTQENVVEIGNYYISVIPDPATICGPTDDRVSSFEPERARLLNIGCTAWLFSEDSCFASAGHCVANPNLVNVVEFNVPASNPNGTLNHPGPEDQYAPDTSVIPFSNGGVGNDWGMFRVFDNSVTGLQPFEAQGAHLTLSTTNPAVGTDVNIVGYGVDSGADNQTQQISFGPLVTSNGTTSQYQADTTGGNSGSGVVSEVTGEAIAIHTHGGCSAGGGQNSGTSVTHPNFQAALASFCPDNGGGIPCSDIQNFQTRCIAKPRGNLMQMRVIFNDNSHAGDTVTFTIDGVDHVRTISGRSARFKVTGATPGLHTVALTDPSGCVPAQMPVCPDPAN